MEVLFVNALACSALQVRDVVQAQQCMVSQVVVTLQDVHVVSPDLKLLLQLNQGTRVLVVLPQVVQQRNGLLALHCRLNGLVANIQGMRSKHSLHTVVLGRGDFIVGCILEGIGLLDLLIITCKVVLVHASTVTFKS